LDLDQLHQYIAETATGLPVCTHTCTLWWDLLLVEPLMHGLSFIAQLLPQAIGGGLAIIIFTILVRLVLLPLTVQQVRSQKAMQKLQPELKALQKKHGSDREKLSQETMALYKEHGVNPAASCLPLALQMPILFALYAAMRNLSSDPNYGQVFDFHVEPFRQSWLWLAGLQHPDIIKDIWIGGALVASLPFAIPGLLPVLAAITQWVQQRMMTQQSSDPQQQMQNQMMQFMPLMMLWFGLSFASGLALYWVTQNVFGIVQQYFSTGWGSLPYLGTGGPSRALSTTSDGEAAGVTDRGATGRPGGRNGRNGTTGGGGSTGSGGAGGGGGGGGRARREGRRASGKR
jgi:YidC/Oxa1 family membrane protein insertase